MATAACLKLLKKGGKGVLQEYLEEIRKTELLSLEEEKRLWQEKSCGDMSAHTRLMTAYQPLVFKIAMSFKLPETETMELIQEGMVGLLEAAESYDSQRGVAFSLFATYRIKGSMLNFLKKSSRLGLVSLEDELREGFSWGDVLVSDKVGPCEAAERHMLQEKVCQAMHRLPVREQQVLTSLLIDDAPAQAVAEDNNISLGHVYRLQKKGIRRIRGMLSRFIHEFNKE